ncbi:MAG: GTPase [Lachnospiraceae bacterium]|nr:GTPase [Lachnospiraceae bacterium]
MKPVYLINGFLDSGKTSFLTFTLQQDYFKIKGTTLLLLCEEGEEEYDEKMLKKARTVVEVLEDEEDFKPSKLIELEKKHSAERILIEYNGMWNMKGLKMPFHWSLEQQITCINAETFPTYYNNMKSMVAEMVRNSELIIFNRCDNCMDSLGGYRRNIKAVNAKADVVFENAQGEIDTIFEEDLPYDLKADTIELDDNSYGIWYIDMMDHIERYEGKKIVFTAMTLVAPQFPKGYFVPGRMIMTCCAEDVSFLGYVCQYDGADTLKNRQWIKVTVIPKKEYYADYHGEGPVLHAVSVTPASKPAHEVIGIG